jgi:glycerol-3-phosphate acyltransferase PlsY
VWFLAFIIAFVSYLFGSFPAGYFAGRITGVDIRSFGSGNIGATNVLRALGKKWGYGVFFVDAFKGFCAVRLAVFLAEHSAVARPYAVQVGIFAGVMCVIGHMFPVWLKFKGGKGVATSAGVVFGLMPLAIVIVFLLWVVVFEITRYVSLASMVAACALPITVALLMHWKMVEGIGLFYFSAVLAILVVWSHRSNFFRLLRGTEQRFTRR